MKNNIWDHPYNSSAKGLGGWSQKNDTFYVTFSTIKADGGWIKKVQICAGMVPMYLKLSFPIVFCSRN